LAARTRSMELIRPFAVRSQRDSARDHWTDEPRLAQRVGDQALRAEWLDRVQEQAGLPLFARRRWLQSWAEAYPEWEPWTLVLRDGSEVRAVAPLARRRTHWGFEVAPIGDGALQESPVAACDDDALAALGAGIAAALRALGRPWRLTLELPNASILATVLASELPVSTLYAGCRRPTLRFNDQDPSSPKQLLGRNTYSALAKARNRIGKEGHRLEVGWEPIREALPEVVTVQRDRDLEQRGATLNARDFRFYRQVIDRHAGYWRLLTVRIDGSLAAFALCLKDGDALRVCYNRVAPGWRRYSAGLIANAELVLRAAADASIGEVDWGCGEQRYKLSLSNDVINAQVLRAWSSSLLRAALAGRNRLDRRRTAMARSSPADI
jgi:hypothetical protein